MQQRLDAAVTDYGAAAADLVEAATAARSSSTSAFLVQRLLWNADFAVDDAQLTESLSGGDVVTALQARTAGATLLQAHRLDGILLDNPRYDPQYATVSRTGLSEAREYRSGEAYAQPGGTIALEPGATIRVEITAAAPDLARHTVTWRLDPGAGLTVTPATGTLTVSGGGPASATVAVTAGAGPHLVKVGLVASSGNDAWSAAGFDVVIAGPGSLVPYFDNTGVSSDAMTANPKLDGLGCGYSQQALIAAGLVSGAKVTADGLVVSWPTTSGSADNVVARGQQLTLPPGTHGSRLVLLAAAAPGDAIGAGWITYGDASRAYYQVEVPAWTQSGGAAQLPGDATLVAQSAYYRCGTLRFGSASVYAVEVPLDRSRDVTSIALPFAFGTNLVHVFGLAIG
jgi:hypothetical protein